MAALAMVFSSILPTRAASTRFTLTNNSQGREASTAIYVTVTGCDRLGRYLHMDSQGRFHPCLTSDNTVERGGTTWAPYSFPMGRGFNLDRSQELLGGRLYLSVGAPLWLRVDPATGGLVQPDLANPTDPNLATTFDWMEFALDASGFHGNTTCVDQFGLPITLQAVDRGGVPTQRVGLPQRRSDLMREFQAAMPIAFQGLVGEGGLRITSPGHAPSGPLATHLDEYISAMWRKYRTEPLVLTPDEGIFTGRVDAAGRLVFKREGDPCPYVIKAMPTTMEAWRCDGPLSSGNALERVLGAQIGAMLNRHLMEQPSQWRDALINYGTSPSNSYSEFWHQKGLGRKAYGFAYDDVNDEATLIYAADPEEIRIGFRID